MSIESNLGLPKYMTPSSSKKPTHTKGRIPYPNFSNTGLITATPAKMSEDKYKDSIISLAEKDALEGKFGGEKNPRYMDLKKSFVSVVSPDRQGIISSALDGMYSTGPKPIRFAEFKDSFGNVIAHYSPQNGWRSIATPNEISRESDFDAIYTSAWRAKYHGDGSTPSRTLNIVI